MRCLAVAMLVLAFAQPFIPTSDDVEQGRKNVSIFVDNSFSMQSFGEDLPLLDRAKQRASAIVDAYSGDDNFQVITHELRGDQQRYLGKEEALLAIEDVEIKPNVTSLQRVLDRQTRLAQMAPDRPLEAYIISDFQESITDIENPDSSMRLSLLPVQAVQEKNISIDSAWFDIPAQILNQNSRLVVTLTNHGSDAVENIKLSAAIDGQERPVSTLTVNAGETITDSVNINVLTTGWHIVTLRITDFPVQFDDTYFISFYVDESISILSINGGGENGRLNAAFANDPNFRLENQFQGAINFSTFRNNDLIILNEPTEISTGMTEELYTFLANGGHVLFFPKSATDVERYNGFLARSGANTFAAYDTVPRNVGSINTDEFLFKNVFQRTSGNLRLPSTTNNYTTNRIQSRGSATVLRYRDGSSFIERYNVGQGQLIVCAAPLDEEISNLARNAEIFIPLLYNAAIRSGNERPAAYTIGKDEAVTVTSTQTQGDQVYRFVNESEFIPAITQLGPRALIDPSGQISEAGFYDLFLADSLVGKYAYNFDRTESALNYVATSDLNDRIPGATIYRETARADLSALIAEQQHGIALWRWCIILALALLGLEALVIRLWRT